MQEAEQVPDGRRLRSERSRQAIIDAMLGLVEEGVLIPTAQQVSSRAGVLEISNTPIGGVYDLNGREFFGQLLYRF